MPMAAEATPLGKEKQTGFFFLWEWQASCNGQIQPFPLAIDPNSWSYLQRRPTDTRCITTSLAFIILCNGLFNYSVLAETVGMVFVEDNGSRCMDLAAPNGWCHRTPPPYCLVPALAFYVREMDCIMLCARIKLIRA